MQTRLFFVAAAAMLILAAGAPAVAHHAFASEFDGSKPVTLKGTVTKMEWINPHAWLHMEVKGRTLQSAEKSGKRDTQAREAFSGAHRDISLTSSS